MTMPSWGLLLEAARERLNPAGQPRSGPDMTEPKLHVAGDESALVDPDPFSMALGILGAVAGAGAWLEARKMRISEREDRAKALRTSWYACVRSVNFLESSVREFETHVSERSKQRFSDSARGPRTPEI